MMATAEPVHQRHVGVPLAIGASGDASWKLRLAKASPTLFQLGADVVAIVVTVVVFYLLRLHQSPLMVPTHELFWSVLGAALVYWIGLFWLSGLYRNWLVRSPFEEAFAVLKVAVVGGAIPLVAMLLESGWFSYKLVAYTVLLAVLVIVARYGGRRLQLHLRSEGVIVFPTMLIGDAEGLADFFMQSNRHASYGYAVVGAITDDGASVLPSDVPVLGSLSEAAHAIVRTKPAVCIVAFRHTDHERMLELASIATANGASVTIVPDLYQVVMGTVRALSLYGVPLIEISPSLLAPWQAVVKRTLDIVVSAGVLLLGIPLWFAIAVAIKLDSPGPVLFTQWRVGRGNRPFKLYKFRSMTHGRWDGTWTQLNDPRVTKVGSIIRRLYLDEIPQFWNVLKGDMSLVGPRPEQVGLVEHFAQVIPYYTRRHIVRPGITGWWQVRRERRVLPDMIQEIRSRLQDDFYYIENMSLRLDVEIIVRTIVVMLRGHGIA
ncbi:MAG: sugar transferase [Chlorobi bacterium]|nr:sugar transferase [Chlorobiota bacterium]